MAEKEKKEKWLNACVAEARQKNFLREFLEREGFCYKTNKGYWGYVHFSVLIPEGKEQMFMEFWDKL